MAHEADEGAAVHGWLSAAEELAAYEGMRHGDERAFRAIAEPLQPALRRLAALYLTDGTPVDAMVLHSWEVALRGADMFRWHTPYATWVAGMTVDHGRSSVVPGLVPTQTATAADPGTERPGPSDWSDLPWSARWTRAPATLAAEVAALPTDLHEVVYGRLVEGWPRRRVCDVFGLPEVAYERRLAEAQDRLHGALRQLVGAAGTDSDRRGRDAAITRCLARPHDPRPEALDPHALAVFRRWSAGRSGWRSRLRVRAS